MTQTHDTIRKESELGPIPQEWEVCRLEEISDIKSGKSRPKEIGEYPVYGGNGILDYANEYNIDTDLIIIGRVGAYCGCVYLEKSKFRLSDNALGLVNNEKSDIRFLYYLLKHLDLNTKSIGGAQPLITQGILKEIEIPLPPLKEQQAIATILGSLDDKIEVLREQNRTLEKMGQTMFYEWFGKYSIEDELPEGWKVGKLGDIVEVDRGLSYKGSGLSDSSEEGIPMLNLGSFEITGGYKHSGIKYYTGEYKDRHVKKPGDILICNTDMTQDRAILGRAIMIPERVGDKVIFTHHVYGVNMKSDLSKHYLLYTLNTPAYRGVAEGYATGTTVLNLPSDAILKFPIIIPDKMIINDFDSQANELYEKQMTNEIQIMSLTQARDNLLPRLMSGKVRLI